MTEYMPGGRRRIDRVLAPGYLDGIDVLDLEEVRARRADADQEEVDLSYARRLLQGRIDILRAEQARRSGDGPSEPVFGNRTDEAIAETLKRILGAEKRTDRGLGRHMAATPSRIGEHRREAERAVSDVGVSDLDMPDADLEAALARLVEIENRVSRSRREVQQVVDALTAEVARRYQLDQVSLADRF
ncbi:hypothetical protein LWF15_30355 [Kineosporia rhizophila]|uniref:RsiG family protein n=1 Tax=Kineosporia TaxID=49184 RepID=UPI001E2E1675|nr:MULTISPECIES: hypothetical protein [Kineosporia]MCE0539808.1 hypothetical protein [Kineosporia rhizophila]GLY13397.1 hypothetical protein Kisp01_04130 [Kineosporia sp. NBRC 101677]